MASKDEVDITEDEAQIYDRQIRLWGVESQKRIRNANILIAGLGGLGADIAKNLILAGIKSVTFLDDKTISLDDKMSQFLAAPDSVGTNRAKASIAGAQALNPLVQITADTGNVTEKQAGFFTQFDVVVVTECDLEQLLTINKICRKQDVKFFCGNVFGMFGYFFADCLRHEHVAEMTYRNKNNDRVFAERVTTYVPLSETLNTDWSLIPPRQFKRMDSSYFIFRVIEEFKKQQNRYPDRLRRKKDIEILKQLSQSVLGDLNLPLDKIPESIYGMLFGQVSPSCSVVGGILAQDVIRAVSKRDTPACNMFFFNPVFCSGTIMNVGNVTDETKRPE